MPKKRDTNADAQANKPTAEAANAGQPDTPTAQAPNAATPGVPPVDPAAKRAKNAAALLAIIRDIDPVELWDVLDAMKRDAEELKAQRAQDAAKAEEKAREQSMLDWTRHCQKMGDENEERERQRRLAEMSKTPYQRQKEVGELVMLAVTGKRK